MTRWYSFNFKTNTHFYAFAVILMTTFCAHASPPQTKQLTINVFDEHELYLQYSRSYSVAWQIMQAAAQKADIELVPFPEVWIRSISFLKQQKSVNAVFGAMPSKERENWTSFSAPLALENISAYTLPDSKLDSLNTLLDNKAAIDIGVTRGSIHENLANQLGFSYVFTFTDRNKVFEMLEANKLDAIVYTHALTSFYCGKFKKLTNNSCLKEIKPAIEESTLHFMFNKADKNTQETVSLIHKKINHLYKSQRIKELFLHNGYKASDYSTWEQKYKNWLKSSF